MKRAILNLLLALLVIEVGSTGCKKQIEQIKEDALTNYLATNRWAVQQFTEGSTDVTAEFEGYEFTFFEDNTVSGTKTGFSTTYTGTWVTNIRAATIRAQFAAGTPRPLSLLNGTWSVATYNSTATTFSQTVGGITSKLILRKK